MTVRSLRPALCALMLAALMLAGQMRTAEAASTDLMQRTAAEMGMATGLSTLREMSPEALDAEFAAYAGLGMRWVRTDLYWSNVQADGPDSYDWTVPDRIVATAQAHGLEVLFAVGTTPPWARSIATERSAPADPADYGAFLGAAARRYGPQGVHAWEVWNEPNLAGPFPTQPDPIRYTRLLVAAHDAIKAADPQAIVLLGGLSPVPQTKASLLGEVKFYGAVDFLAAVYDEGGGKAFDALGFHPYSYPRMPDDPAPWSGWSMMTGPIRKLMAEHGDAGKKIWITEYGAPTSPQGKVSEAQQADMLKRSVALARAADWAGPYFWYSYRDLGTDPGNNENWFGLLHADGTPKPALKALEALEAVAAPGG